MKQEFDHYANEYDALLADPLRDNFANKAFFHKRKLHLLRKFFQRHGLDSKTRTWADIGCGQGDLLKLGAADFRMAFGCDVSPGMLESCAGLEVRRQERSDVLPFGDHFADLATAVCVYHHVPVSERPALSREVGRILKHGGIFCIVEHNPLNPVTRTIVKRAPIDRDAVLLRASETRQLLEAQGFRILATEYFLFFPEPVYRRVGFTEDWIRRFPLGGQYAVFAEAA